MQAKKKKRSHCRSLFSKLFALILAPGRCSSPNLIPQPWPLPHLERGLLQVHWQVLKFTRVSAYLRGGFPLETQPLSSKANLSPSCWVVSSGVQPSGDEGMSARRREAAHSLGAGRRLSDSSSFLLPSAWGCWDAPLSPSHWLVFTGLLSLPLFPTLPSLSITHSCLSLSLLLSSLTLPFFLPAGALPPSPSQLSNFSDCACFVNSKSRLLPTKTHTDKNWLLQTMFYSLSLLLPLLPLSPTDNEISSDAVILLMSFTSHQKE